MNSRQRRRAGSRAFLGLVLLSALTLAPPTQALTVEYTFSFDHFVDGIDTSPWTGA